MNKTQIYALVAMYFTAGILTVIYRSYIKDNNLSHWFERFLITACMTIMWAGFPLLTIMKLARIKS